jgi:hypothetical protein
MKYEKRGQRSGDEGPRKRRGKHKGRAETRVDDMGEGSRGQGNEMGGGRNRAEAQRRDREKSEGGRRGRIIGHLRREEMKGRRGGEASRKNFQRKRGKVQRVEAEERVERKW